MRRAFGCLGVVLLAVVVLGVLVSAKLAVAVGSLVGLVVMVLGVLLMTGNTSEVEDGNLVAGVGLAIALLCYTFHLFID